MNRVAIVFCTVLSAFLLSPANASKPNIIFILADDLGYSDLGCYGGEIQTPNLDSLANKGLRFTEFYNTGRCWPSRAALMTGYYAQQVHRDKLPGSKKGGGQGKRQSWARMIPDFLTPLGYRSYHSGKWHLDGTETEAGFIKLDQKQKDLLGLTGNPAIDGDAPARDSDPGRAYWSDNTTDDVIAHLRDHARQHPDQPFFQYIAYDAPHFPLQAPQSDILKYKDRYDDGWEHMREQRYERMKKAGIVTTGMSDLEPEVGPPYPYPDAVKKFGPGEIDRPLPWSELTGAQHRFQAEKMAIHAAMVDRMDQQIGRVLAQLKAMGQFEDTLIFFASDNGASAEIMIRGKGHDPQARPGSGSTHLCLGPGFSSACNTPFRRHKVWTHEGGIATPLIVHWPAGISSRGELRHTPGHLIDIVPTILDVLNSEKPIEWEGEPIPSAPGRSLLPAFAENLEIARDSLWWLHEDNRAVRAGNWKLVSSKGEPWELYNLKNDRAETHDLSKMHPELAQRLERQWLQQLEEITTLTKTTSRAPSTPHKKSAPSKRTK